MAHEHRNNPMIDWNSLWERAKKWIFQIIFISKEIRESLLTAAHDCTSPEASNVKS